MHRLSLGGWNKTKNSGCLQGGEKTGREGNLHTPSMQFAVCNRRPAPPTQTDESLVKTGNSPVRVSHQTVSPLRTGTLSELLPNSQH